MISEEYRKQVTVGESHWLDRDSCVGEFVASLTPVYEQLEGLDVLDAGCAQGRDTVEISSHGVKAQGIDSNAAFISQARIANPSLTFDVGDIERLPYATETFDAVYCVNTLFYTDPHKSLPELERVVKPGGIIFITLDQKLINSL